MTDTDKLCDAVEQASENLSKALRFLGLGSDSSTGAVQYLAEETHKGLSEVAQALEHVAEAIERLAGRS
jgi:hypothetical protein